MGIFGDLFSKKSNDKVTAWATKNEGYINTAKGFVPTSGASFEQNLLGGAVQGSLDAFLSGNILGAVTNITKAVSTLLNPDKYRQEATKSRLKSAWTIFENSAKDLKAINALFATIYQNHAMESTKKGEYEKWYMESLLPLETALLKDGYSFKMVPVTNVKYKHSKKVWSEPKSIFGSLIGGSGDGDKPGEQGSGGVGSLALFGGIGYALLSILKK